MNDLVFASITNHMEVVDFLIGQGVVDETDAEWVTGPGTDVFVCVDHVSNLWVGVDAGRGRACLIKDGAAAWFGPWRDSIREVIGDIEKATGVS
jgi:hypothetical protein